MAYTPDDPNIRKVGDPIKAELLRRISTNITDLDERINSVETTGGSVFILNDVACLAGLDSTDPFIFYYKVTQDFSITDFRVQIFNKGSVSSGSLAFDLQKSTDTNNANFNTVLTSDLSFNFATDASYAEKVASINSSVSDIVAGSVLRIEVKSTPANFGGKVLIVIGAE